MGLVWDSNSNDPTAKIVRLHYFGEYLCLVVSNLPVSLQTRSLELPSAPLVDTRKYHLLVVPAPSSRRYNPRTVSEALWALRGEAGAIGTRGGVDSFKPLHLDTPSHQAEVYYPRELHSRR